MSSSKTFFYSLEKHNSVLSKAETLNNFMVSQEANMNKWKEKKNV